MISSAQELSRSEASYEPMMRDLSDLEGDDLDEVRDLARDIFTAQLGEIQMMARWLDTWFGVQLHVMPMHG